VLKAFEEEVDESVGTWDEERERILGWESVLFMLEKTVVFVENDLSIEFDRI
jgi:hypothetical protein